ncbi:VOC family protein [Kangiella sediminilitoris]|uniref:Glyoxalase n=1 Tax=Kangiella sediminilitoris TaxID=1144748 RepID=A0A1B3BAL8_9GAMM|nr:VOC family protein [Kangiella sediminilitoris]AOE49843.1 glyoxalase [Kangiella sediminilitoris]
MKIEQIHHVAYRCVDAKETVDFYTEVLNMDFMLAIAEDKVPSTKEPDPYMHLFMDAGNGNILAFFELPNSPDMGKDPNTPDWVQHIAFRVKDEDALLKAKERIESHGIEVIGPTNHEIIKSIYFFDPNGHRLELTTVTATDDMFKRLNDVKWDMLNEWTKTKKAPKQAEWLHSEEFNQS